MHVPECTSKYYIVWPKTTKTNSEAPFSYSPFDQFRYCFWKRKMYSKQVLAVTQFTLPLEKLILIPKVTMTTYYYISYKPLFLLYVVCFRPGEVVISYHD